jgi:hypothetical protein
MSLAISRILMVVGSIIEWSIDLAHGFESAEVRWHGILRSSRAIVEPLQLHLSSESDPVLKSCSRVPTARIDVVCSNHGNYATSF